MPATVGESVCRSCGACCAHLRVLFPDHEGAEVSADLRESAQVGHSRMRRAENGACVAFEGDIGVHTGCRIYAVRPMPCRSFDPSTAALPNPHCDDARSRSGLPRLW